MTRVYKSTVSVGRLVHLSHCSSTHYQALALTGHLDLNLKNNVYNVRDEQIGLVKTTVYILTTSLASKHKHKM